MSTVSTAGCVISVRRSSLLGLGHRVGVAGSTKMMSDSARPSSSGAMIASASSNVAATTGSVPPQLGEHVGVLRALAGVEEGDLAGRGRCRGRCRGPAAPSTRPGCPTRAPSAPARPWRPARRRRRSRWRPARARASRLGGRRRGRGRSPAPRRHARSRVGECRLVVGAEHERAAQRRLRRGGGRAGDAGAPPGSRRHVRRHRDRRVRRCRWTGGRARTPRARRGSWCRRSRTR